MHGLRSLRATPRTTTLFAKYVAPTLSTRVPVLRRSIASSGAAAAPALQEWFVICPDFDGVLEKRLEMRPEHLSKLKQDRDDFWLWGGPMLEKPIHEGDEAPPMMKGSAMLVGARTREEVVERLSNDVYVSAGVWDWDKVQIFPFKSTLRKAL